MRQSIVIMIVFLTALFTGACEDSSITTGNEPDGDLEASSDGDAALPDGDFDDDRDDEMNSPSDGDLEDDIDPVDADPEGDGGEDDSDPDAVCLCGPDVSDCCDGCDLIIGYCLIDGACISDGEDDPDAPCLFCDADAAPLAWTAQNNGAVCDDDDACSTRSNCRDGVCTAVEWIANDCTEYMECGWSPSGCFECGSCDTDTQVCWECDSSLQSCWPGDDIDTKVCAPGEGGACGDMSGLQAGSPWPMDGGCVTLQNRSTAVGPNAPSIRWARWVGERVRSAPTIDADGKIYVPTMYEEDLEGELVAVTPHGDIAWRYDAGDWVSQTSPAIAADGTMYIAVRADDLVAVDASGQFKWSYPITMNASPSIAADGTVYIGSALDQSLYAITPAGNLRWRFETDGWVESTPAIGDDGTLYFGSRDGNVYAVSPTGEEVWRYEAGGWFAWGPSIGADGTIYIANVPNGELLALTPAGEAKWRFSREGMTARGRPTIGPDGTIHVIDGVHERFYALRPDGQTRWSHDLGAGANFTPVADADGTVFVGDELGVLHAIASTGQSRWVFHTGAPFYYTSLAMDDVGDLYFGSDSGYLYALGDCREGDPCMEDRALIGDGEANSASIADDALILPTTTVTIEAWVKWNGEKRSILYHEGNKLTLNIRMNGSVEYSEWRPEVHWAPMYSGEGSLTSGIWHHIAVTRTPDRYTFFIDGRELTHTEAYSYPYTGSIEPAVVGAFDGMIDELRISSTVRYTEDFEPAFRHEPDENTIGLWHFDVGRDEALFAAHGQLPPGSLEGSAVRTENGGGIGRDWLCATGWTRCADATTVDICNESGRWVEWHTCEGLETCQETGNRQAACVE